MFLILLLVLLAFVATVVLLALPHVFSGRGLRLLRRGVVAFDVLTAVGLVLGPIVFHEVMGVSAVLLRIASVGFVMQIFFALLTGLGVYDDMARFSGAGTLVPITGFANSVVAPAIEYKTEGMILGTAAKMFIISGPVIVYGISSGVIYGILLLIFGAV